MTITSRDCTASGNTLVITEPDDPDTVVFDDGCSLTAGDFFDLNGGAQYAAGTELRAQMISGSNDPEPHRAAAARDRRVSQLDPRIRRW